MQISKYLEDRVEYLITNKVDRATVRDQFIKSFSAINEALKNGESMEKILEDFKTFCTHIRLKDETEIDVIPIAKCGAENVFNVDVVVRCEDCGEDVYSFTKGHRDTCFCDEE